MDDSESIESIAIVLYDGFDELDAVGPYEVFSTAADAGADLDVSLVTLEPADRVTASHGLRVDPDSTLDDANPDLLVVPGGGWNDRSEAGAWAQAEQGDLPAAAARLYDAGATVASVCTGGMLLAEGGVLDDRPAITHASAVEELRAAGVEVVDARVVDAGDVVTAGGVTAGIDLALHLVAEIAGREVAERVATVLEYEPATDVYRAD